MKIDYVDDCKGVLIVDVNGTINTIPYFDNKDLLRLVNSVKKFDMQIVDFNKKCTYVVYDEISLERVRSDYSDSNI